ncbi:MAG TPA: DNA ligase D [Acetobacteraceae bacterium]|nr:DNA ligase D [Acetobacteraceae bacterium]
MPRAAVSGKRSHTGARDTSIRTYRAKRDFAVTAEPAPGAAPASGAAPIFVVQKHTAHRAGLHWDFRLQHGGVLWSWAVRKGPSLDPAVKHAAAHVEDHPLDYAAFEGEIPAGQYGAGKVELWDRGTWEPLDDPEAGMKKGELTFLLHGTRLNGRFHLVRLKPKQGERARPEAWLLFKGHDEFARAGADAPAIEAETPPPAPADPPSRDTPPAPGAKRSRLPRAQEPQLCTLVAAPPEGEGWISEIKFDGYRLLAFLDDGEVRLLTRNGHDWTDRLPAIARAVAAIRVRAALFDGELVALHEDGSSSFPDLQGALAAGQDARLYFFVFDLLHLDGWDLRPCRLIDRKRVLAGLASWSGLVRYSDHQEGDAAGMWQAACRMHLEGIVCKRADAPYQPGRGPGWVKVKCQGRKELIVLGWTPPRGSRNGLGALHLGYFDDQHRLHYAGGVGTGFSEDELERLRARLDRLAAPPPDNLLVAGDPLDPAIRWVRPEVVVEVQFTGWSGAGRVRHAVYLGERLDKPAEEVVMQPPDPDAPRKPVIPRQGRGPASKPPQPVAVPPRRRAAGAAIVTARAPKARSETYGTVNLTHPDRELWPGITKHDLAEYWRTIAEHALPGLVRRPLAIVRCPEGIAGEHFFQKRGHAALPPQIREGETAGSPYLAIDDLDGLFALAQMSAIELHAWGSSEADPLRPDQIVLDLDPGEGVAFARVVSAAHEVRDRLKAFGLASFCRTTGGKGLHIVAPLAPRAGWDAVKAFCHTLAETMSQEAPDKYLPTVKKIDRRGRILVDWLRNGLGATAVASFCPRARPGATVATPLGWDEVTPGLDPSAFTLRTVPPRLKAQRADPWAGFEAARTELPKVATERTAPRRARRPVVVFAPKPRRR